MENQIEAQILQINPTESLRKKRALINPLGSLIKCITGNLDDTDAKFYDNEIRILQESQNEMKTNLLNQITILHNVTIEFQNLISNLSHNQLILESRIMQIKAIIESVALQQTIDREHLKIHTIINQIATMYQLIYHIFQKVEMAATFAKLNTLHNAIINPLELQKEIKTIQKFLTTDILPLEPKENNILNFEKIITIKSYSKAFTIYFILEIPLVDREIFQYYRLYSIPIPSNKESTFNLIIPQKPYLAIGNEKYFYTDQLCKEFGRHEFLCPETHISFIKNHPPCEVQLLLHQSNISCQPFQINLVENQVTKITDGKWIITIPKQVIVTTTCENSRTNQPLLGSYLVESTPTCNLQFEPFVLRSYGSRQLKFENPKLPSLNFSNYDNPKMVFNPPELSLSSINLQETKKLQDRLEEQKVQLKNILTPVINQKLETLTIVTPIIIFLILIFIIYKCCFKKHSTNTSVD